MDERIITSNMLKEDKDEEWDYTVIFVNKEENDLLKEWLKDDTPRT